MTPQTIPSGAIMRATRAAPSHEQRNGFECVLQIAVAPFSRRTCSPSRNEQHSFASRGDVAYASAFVRSNFRKGNGGAIRCISRRPICTTRSTTIQMLAGPDQQILLTDPDSGRWQPAAAAQVSATWLRAWGRLWWRLYLALANLSRGPLCEAHKLAWAPPKRPNYPKRRISTPRLSLSFRTGSAGYKKTFQRPTCTHLNLEETKVQ
jgi:hypothetical protein